jgi:hypothetical protein
MPEHPDAAQRIRTKLKSATLPPANVRRMILVSGGRGALCDACDTTISTADLISVVDCIGKSGQLRMHAACVAIWQYQSSPGTLSDRTKSNVVPAGVGSGQEDRTAITCAYCRRPVSPTGAKVIARGAVYHPGCRDRKARTARR